MTSDERTIGSSFVRPWILANFLAFAIGGGLAGGVLRALDEPWFDSGVSALQGAYIQAISVGAAGVFFAGAIGFAQWLVLRRIFHAVAWLPATFIGWAAMGFLMGFLAGGSVSRIGPDQGPVPPIVALLVGYPFILFCIAGPQWLVLRRAFNGAGIWPLATIVGAGMGFGLGLAIATSLGRSFLALTEFPSAKVLIVVGAVGGIVYGALTGPILAQMRHR